jgi:hypothetical protein
MVKIKTVSCPKLEYAPTPLFEVYELTSEDDYVNQIIEEANTWLYSTLSSKIKNPVYQIMLISDQNPEKALRKMRTIVTKEEHDIIHNATNKPYLGMVVSGLEKDQLLDYYSDDVAKTEAKAAALKWINTTKKFLANTFEFKGDVKTKCAFINGTPEYFELTLSGKGTTDYLVSKFKSLQSETGLLNSWFTDCGLFYNSSEDDIFAMLKEYFES